MAMENVMVRAIEITTQPSWKLYDNPHYNDTPQKLECSLYNLLPPPRPILPLHMEIELVKELRAEIERERTLRRKAESLNQALARELADERSTREEVERMCVRLEDEVERMVKEQEEDRRMLRTAEVWREERVQMKLNEARLVLEEKLREMMKTFEGEEEENTMKVLASDESGNGGKMGRREAENPHIKRGIKGYVEFARVARVRGGGGGGFSTPSSTREGKGQLESSVVECQRAQLRVLSSHRSTVGLGLMGSAENLVM